MKRFALLAIAALVLGVAAPAFAQTGATARVTSPSDGGSVSGSINVSGTASAATGVRNAKLFIGDTLVASAEPSNLRQEVDLSYNWDTTTAFGGGIARNGWVQIRVEMAASGGGNATSKINVMVDNAPATPSGFDGYVQDTTATLEWAANPEPDITGYRIEVGSGGSWATATEVTGTSYSANLQPGTYQFRILAIRNSPDSPNGRLSAPTAPVSLTIQAPASTDGGSTGGSGGVIGSGGGGRGATGGGDPRVYGRDGATSAKDVKDLARAFGNSGSLSFGGLSLPGSGGLPDLPGTEPFKWGTYKERLPYSLPQGGIPLEAAPTRLAALSTTVIPMDALRWVGLGTLMIVIAAMLHFMGWRAETIARLGSEGAASLRVNIPKISMPAVSFKDADVRIRRVQDRVRATWKKARGS